MATAPELEVTVHVAQAEAVYVPLSEIDPNPYQVRLSEDPEAVAKMAASIEANTMLQIPAARWVGEAFELKSKKRTERYQLAFGHTRYAAYTALYAQGKSEYAQMPLIKRPLTDRQMFEMAVTENVQRRDLTPIEEARAMRRALDEFGYTSAQVGELFGVSGETVRGKIRLLAMPDTWRFNDQGPVALAKHLQGVAKEWGVKLPADWMERAEGMMPPAPKSQESTTKGTKGHKAKSKKGRKK